MEIITFFWQQYLYTPLFNLLIWLYLNYSWYNLGVAVIVLTIILRVALLPLTILSERGKVISQKIKKEIAEIRADHVDDPVQQKLMIRQLLKRKKIRPWANAVVLGVQGVILVLLYQVFIGGINTAAKLHLIYPSIPRPDFINTQFFWFDIGQTNLLMAAIVAGYLFADILIISWQRKHGLSRREQIYSIFFPVGVFLILALLPAVKSIFILTSLIISSIISIITILLKKAINKAKQRQSP